MSGLMQIAEPGMSSAPHEERLAVGIDLGTTNSLVATVVNGSVEVIADEKGRKILPSIVRFCPTAQPRSVMPLPSTLSMMRKIRSLLPSA